MKRVVLLLLSSSFVFAGELDNTIPRLKSYIVKIDKQIEEGIISKEILGIQKKQIEDQIKAYEKQRISPSNYGQ